MRSPRRIAATLAVAALLVLLVSGAASAADPAGPQAGYLEIGSNPPGATVFVNGAKMDSATPLTLRVQAGLPQEVVIDLYGCEAQRQTITVQPGQTVPLEFDLFALPGAGLAVETAGALPSATAPPEGGGSTPAPEEVPVEETPATAVTALLALAGAGLLARRS